ncbi:hypothetical protein ACFOUP_18240 [Belliella kenyensis]|uniref:Outer membrane protein beta-barrel domain-containing protein n=1 Tax=Belliella kenyensis TaxID=1472724 RepID=A0ABV8EPV1_9BACT|nr:hypothetical protein [Belliella kenyensis]MCH7402279.1 hypothetical protein [Belliella kenyensis]MDN3601795.1 hypothetical protein [Belliella kenyensis]
MNKNNLPFLMLLMLFSSNALLAQTENVFRVNFLNPGISYEKSLGKKMTLDTGIGFGYNASYPSLAMNSENGFQYMLAAFVDVQSRFYYNFEKRESKGKSTLKNSGNFLALRALYTGPDAVSNFERYDNNSFAFGPTWGLQRAYSKLNVAFSMGPIYYFDTSGNSNWSPFWFELNLGINVN